MPDWFRHLYATPLRLLALGYDLYMANRGHLKSLMARPRVAQVFRALVVLTAVLWLLVFLFADERHGERLDAAFKALYRPDQPPATQIPAD